MPLKVNVGLSKKIGQPNYGSLGATCEVEYEADGGLLQHDLDAFQRQVKSAFAACRQAVHEELFRTNGEQNPSAPPPSGHGANGSDGPAADKSGNGPSASPGNGRSDGPDRGLSSGPSSAPSSDQPNAADNGHSPPRRSYRKCTLSQARAIRNIADRLQLDLAAWLLGKFGLRMVEDLSIGDASQTIDEFKALLAEGGEGGQR